MYLTKKQTANLARLLKTFFALPYSTDLDGKDAEYILRTVKQAIGRLSKRKELFDFVDGTTGYSVKTLRKPPNAQRVDLQEQRFCDVDEIRRVVARGTGDPKAQGKIILSYMRNRIVEQMEQRGVKRAKSAILLKWWDKARRHYSFRYWEEDFVGFIDDLWERNQRGEIEWLLQTRGVHARDTLRPDGKGKNVRLLRMHHKHNQIFTDHDIPSDAVRIEFDVQRVELVVLADMLKL